MNKQKIMTVRKKGVMRHRATFKYFREDHPDKWNSLRAGGTADIDLSEWASTFQEEFNVPIEIDFKRHFFNENPGLGEVFQKKETEINEENKER